MSEDEKKDASSDSPSEFLKDLEKKVKVKKKERVEEERNNNEPPRAPKNNEPPRGQRFDFSFIMIVSLLLFILAVIYFTDRSGDMPQTTVSYSDFVKGVNEGKIKSVDIVNNEKIVFVIDNIRRTTDIPYTDNNLLQLLLSHDVEVNARTERDSLWKQLLVSSIPWIIIFLVFYFFIYRATRSGKGGLGDGFTFGRSRAKQVTKEMATQRFKDVQGCDEAKQELDEVVSFLKSPKKYTDIGAQIPKGVLLVGPPGNGKTLLAKAVSGEAGVPFFFVSGSDFVEMFVGVGASRVRDLFNTARKNTPCIVFVDEIDAVGRTRGVGYGGGNDEREQTLNQLLVELDGFDSQRGMIVLAATNRADVLDKALLRPGRFDRQVFVGLPDLRGRRNILEVHSKKVKLAKGIDLDRVARATPGFSGADLANLINEAALISARNGKKAVGMDELDEARDKILMGPQRSSMLLDEAEKEMTAYHEAGHALVALLLEHTKSLHKVTIIPRGGALGVTSFLPDDGKHTYSKTQLIEEIMVTFGGRAAEEIIYNEVSTGASNDIKVATKIARSMVMQFGMSDLGMVAYTSKPPYLVENDGNDEGYSEEFSKEIDKEVAKMLNGLYDKTVELLKENKDKLSVLAEELVEKETLDVEDVYVLLDMKKKPKQKIKRS